MKTLEQLIEIIKEEIEVRKAFPGANVTVVTHENATKLSLGKKSLYDVDSNNNLIDLVEENTLDTIYDMASLSKVISTTTCILRLLDLGKIRLGSKVSSYLPRFKHNDITILHLLTHTSGLSEGVRGLMNMKTSDDVMNAIYDMDLVYETGTKISYSDVGFILIGKIIETVTGKTLDVFAKEEIFDPLEMFNTGYNPQNIELCAPTEHRNDPLFKGMVKGFVHDETAVLLGGVAGHAGLFSTIEDVSHFIEMILNNGEYKGKQIISESSIELIYRPFVQDTKGVDLHGTVRTIGWLLGGNGGSDGDLTSMETIHHTGFTGTNLWIDRYNGIGFCMLTNRVHPTRKNLLHLESRCKIANFVIANKDKF